ncbi:Zinc finger and BTB domain-containing protein 17 [Fukomys damarensis]|uniref:Zinc finger and BTB domain-containing protein 17 n=1 Tax=Fukomys damarensis TaxID=885580 RepID=A0A091D8I4_FUKDA|nr:Zinc finger and BTB domain-containing protein 17 [Fukomys damarensis]
MDFPQHSHHVLEQLNQQRQLGLLCDCTFVVDGVNFKAHKAVLAACSEYFKMLFVDQKDVVHLDISNAAGLGQVLEFMYTAKLSLSPENVDDVLAVASFLQMQDIVTACHTLKSLAEPVTSPGENMEAPASEGGDRRAKEKAAATRLSRLDQAGSCAPPGPGGELKEERGGQAESTASGAEQTEKADAPREPLPVELKPDPTGGMAAAEAEAALSESSEQVLLAQSAHLRPAEAHTRHVRVANTQVIRVLPCRCRAEDAPPGECGKSYRLISLLNLHKKRHSGEARYRCEDCGKLFTTSGNLKRHQLVHSGEKPYQCDYCGRSFSDPTSKMRHLETHDTDKEHKCPHCDKKFNQPYLCDKCGRGFNRVDNLRSHVKTVHQGKAGIKILEPEDGDPNTHILYACDSCGDKFLDANSLAQHWLKSTFTLEIEGG